MTIHDKRASRVPGHERPSAPHFDEPAAPLLTVIVPVYNEVATIDAALARVLAVSDGWQVLVVDDGSTDGTSQRLDAWQARGIHVLRHIANRGKGTAIRTALPHAVGRFTIVQDADLEVVPEDIPTLLEMATGLYDDATVVFGSRYLGAGQAFESGRRTWRWGVAALNAATRWLYGAALTDQATCYKLFPTDVLRRMDLLCQRFEYCAEVTAKACRLGLSIREVPIQYHPRGVTDGKKIRYSDGAAALWTLWKYRRWSPRAAVGNDGSASCITLIERQVQT